MGIIRGLAARDFMLRAAMNLYISHDCYSRLLLRAYPPRYFNRAITTTGRQVWQNGLMRPSNRGNYTMNNMDNNPNLRDFIYTVPERIFLDNSLSLNELKIYMIIRSFMDTTGKAYPSNKWVADKLGINSRNTIHNINKLLEKGYIERIEHNGRRFLRIKLSIGVEEVVSPASPPHVASDTPPHVASDTLLYQTNIITKKDLKPLVDLKKSTDYKDDNLFMRFYSIYPNKQKPEVARKAFYKHKTDIAFVELIVNDVLLRIKNNWHGRHKNKIPHPSTYLNGKEWQGEIVTPESPNKSEHPVTASIREFKKTYQSDEFRALLN